MNNMIDAASLVMKQRSGNGNGLYVGQSVRSMMEYISLEIEGILKVTNDDVIVIDVDGALADFTQANKGEYISLESKGDIFINPCDLDLRWEDDKSSPLVEKIDYLTGFIETMLGRGSFSRGLNEYEKNAISRTCSKMYEPYIEEMIRRHEQGDTSSFDPEACPTLRNLYDELIIDGTPEGTKLAMIIEPYSIGSFNVFSHHSNYHHSNRLTVFNSLYIPDRMQGMAIQTFIGYIQQIIGNRIKNKKSDNLWVYLYADPEIVNITDNFAANYSNLVRLAKRTNTIVNLMSPNMPPFVKTLLVNSIDYLMPFNPTANDKSYLRDCFDISLLDYNSFGKMDLKTHEFYRFEDTPIDERKLAISGLRNIIYELKYRNECSLVKEDILCIEAALRTLNTSEEAET